MFNKVLVAEDMDSVNHAVSVVLQKIGITDIVHAQYCDEAYLKAKKAFLNEVPFELLICDLSFKSDHREEKIKSGRDLVALLKQEQPELKVIINSVEDNPQMVKALWESGYIEGYVCKDRHGMQELEKAVRQLTLGKTYMCAKIEKALKNNHLYLLSNYEISLLNHLANGLTQEEIQQKFREENIKATSKSSIEKRLKELRENFKANTTPHLISIVKDLRII